MNTEYVTKEGDRLDTISWAAYGSAYQWGLILEANPTLPISHSYPAGMKIILPIARPDAVRGSQDQLPPWKNSLADG